MSKSKNEAVPVADPAAEIDAVSAGADAATNVDAAAAGADATTISSDVPATVPARVLCTSHIGTIGDIIQLPADVALAYQADGYVDLHPSAVTPDEPAA